MTPVYVQEIPRTPGGTPSLSSRFGTSTSQQGKGQFRQGVLSVAAGAPTAEISAKDETDQGKEAQASAQNQGGPTNSMIQLALRRKFANTRQSLLQDRRYTVT